MDALKLEMASRWDPVTSLNRNAALVPSTTFGAANAALGYVLEALAVCPGPNKSAASAIAVNNRRGSIASTNGRTAAAALLAARLVSHIASVMGRITPRLSEPTRRVGVLAHRVDARP